MRKVVLVALGGNAIIKEKESGTVTEQFKNTRHALEGVVEIVRDGYDLVLTHGNGPQVGNLLIRVEEAKDKAYDVPLGVCVAQSQGEMGYMIGQTLQNHLQQRGIHRRVATLLTQVEVSRNDPSLKDPQKPVGPFYSEAQALALRQRGLVVEQDAGRGFRRRVPSPMPLSIVESAVIAGLASFGVLVIACGGGGVPVYREADGRLEGVDAVVDKDLASSLLASEINAKRMVILTSVDKVAINYGKTNQCSIDRMTCAQAQQYLDQGEFLPGSMKPKIEAAINFLRRGGESVVITSAENFVQAWNGGGGTWIAG